MSLQGERKRKDGGKSEELREGVKWCLGFVRATAMGRTKQAPGRCGQSCVEFRCGVQLGAREAPARVAHHGQDVGARWEYGNNLNLHEHKAGLAGIAFASGTERGTSSHGPGCQPPQRPTGRNFTCRRCGVSVHCDVMGAVNQHRLSFGQPVSMPKGIKYLPPGEVFLRQTEGNKNPALVSSSRPDAGHGGNAMLSCGAGESGNRLAKSAPRVGTGIQALAAAGSPLSQQGRSRARPQARSESHEARPIYDT